MAYTNQLNEYQRTAVTGASPLQLVIMLYDGAIRFIAAATTAMREGKVYEQNQNLQRAQKIVAELMSTLDMERGGEVAKNLFGLYGFVYNQLVTGNLEDDLDSIAQASRVLSELRDSWSKLEATQRNQSEGMNHVSRPAAA